MGMEMTIPILLNVIKELSYSVSGITVC